MSSFRFKQFTVEQSDVAMKVGTDGVLVGAWAPVDGQESRILDVGTGTGLIALMMAQRTFCPCIVGIDSDPAACARAESNFSLSPWASRLRSVHSRIQTYDDGRFDLIVSNPPFFHNSLHSPVAERTLARHDADLPLSELDESVDRLLATNGRFVLILPYDAFQTYLFHTRLSLVSRCDVRTVPDGDVRRTMGVFTRSYYGKVSSESMTIETERRGEFSERYRSLTSDFYLKF